MASTSKTRPATPADLLGAADEARALAAECVDDVGATELYRKADQLGEAVLAHRENDNYARAHAAQDIAAPALTNKPSGE